MYNTEELEIVDCIEESNPKSVQNLSNQMDAIKLAVSAQYTKSKAIKIKDKI